MTTDQVLIGVGLILVLAVGSQVLAGRLRIPALIVLLPGGFVAGALIDDVDPQRLLGPAFSPLVSLAVAVILYDAGLGLDLTRLQGHTRRVVVRLIWVGVLITWVLGTLFAVPLLGMSTGGRSCWARSSWSPGRRWSGRCSASSGRRSGCSASWSGRLPHRPGRRHPGRTGLPRGLASTPHGLGSGLGQFLASVGIGAGRRRSSAARCCGCCPARAAARRGPRHHGPARRGDRCGGVLRCRSATTRDSSPP